MTPETKVEMYSQILEMSLNRHRGVAKRLAESIRESLVVPFCEDNGFTFKTGLNWWKLDGPPVDWDGDEDTHEVSDGDSAGDREDAIHILLSMPVPGLSCELGCFVRSYPDAIEGAIERMKKIVLEDPGQIFNEVQCSD